MLYRNKFNDLIYRRESDGKLFLLMEGMTVGNKSEKKTYDVIIVFEYDESKEDFGAAVTWFYGASFADDEYSLISDLKKFVG
jgi:hypothetical protein